MSEKPVKKKPDRRFLIGYLDPEPLLRLWGLRGHHGMGSAVLMTAAEAEKMSRRYRIDEIKHRIYEMVLAEGFES